MKNLTDQQILSTLRLNEVFPETVWFTEARGMESITVYIKEDSTLEEGLYAVRTVFPNASLEKFATCNTGHYIWSLGECIGTLHMKKEETPLSEGVSEEIIHSKNNTVWTLEEVMRREG